MPKTRWSGDDSRRIGCRIVIEGDLALQTPTHLGNGDGDDLSDMPLLLDPFEGRPLLTGATIAGALRSYLRSRELGYGKPLPSVGGGKAGDERSTYAVKLFGGNRADDDGSQSLLISDDSLATGGGVEFRQGVKIATDTRTAEAKKLFEIQLWQAGTRFPLRFELLIPEDGGKGLADDLKRGLATALTGLTDGGISLGARKTRGYGQVVVERWRIKAYDLTTASGLLDWLENGDQPLPESAAVNDLAKALGVTPLADNRKRFQVKAAFFLQGSLLVRSSGDLLALGAANDQLGPDSVHLNSRTRDGEVTPILPGTSLAGALRARALRIVRTIAPSDERAVKVVRGLFGAADEDGSTDPFASRIVVREEAVRGGRNDLVQNRVSIDRFTGGVRHSALFNEQPVFAGEDTRVDLDIAVHNPDDHEIGLLMLVLKDLWTGDLPLGGESSVGRGRLAGVSANLTLSKGGRAETWNVEGPGAGLKVPPEDREKLQAFVGALHAYLRGDVA